MAELTNAQVALQAATAVAAGHASKPGGPGYSSSGQVESSYATLQRASEYLKWLSDNTPTDLRK